MFFLSWDLFFLPSILLSRMLCTSRSIDTASSCSLSPYVRQRRRIYHQRVLVERWTLSWQQNGKRKRISCPHPKGECVTLIAAIGTYNVKYLFAQASQRAPQRGAPTTYPWARDPRHYHGRDGRVT